MMSKTHELKIEDEYLTALLDGSKTFEVRFNDRDYQIGDVLRFAGVHEFTVTYMLTHEQFFKGLAPGFVVLGVQRTVAQDEAQFCGRITRTIPPAGIYRGCSCCLAALTMQQKHQQERRYDEYQFVSTIRDMFYGGNYEVFE